MKDGRSEEDCRTLHKTLLVMLNSTLHGEYNQQFNTGINQH